MITTILKAKHYPYDRALNEFLATRKMSGPELKDWQTKQRWDIVKYHYENNSFYRHKVGNIPESWEDIPIISKNDLTAEKNIISLLSEKFKNKRNLYISNTSGSSGHPFYFAKDKYTHARTWACIAVRYADLGISLADKQARFYGIPLNTKGYITERLKDYFMNRVRFPIMDLSDASFKNMINIFNKKKFIYIYGYAQSLVCFCNYLSTNNINIREICPSLKLIITTSEMLSSNEKKSMETTTTLPIYDEYGASETGYMGMWNNYGYWDSCDENVYLETDSDGRLLVTDLFNKAMPFIRYSIGDNVKLEADDSMRTKILELLGRTNDIIILPSGKQAAGLTFYYISKSLLENSKININEFIIRQTSLDTFDFDIISTEDISTSIINEIKTDAIKYLEPGIKINVNRVDSIRRPSSGKIQHFYSEIK